jgi:hypothetical protein
MVAFGRQNGRTLDVVHLAMMPLARMACGESPFDRFCPDSTPLTGEIGRIVSTGVSGYQLFTYLQMIESLFGTAVADSVRTHQIHILNRVERAGDKLFSVLDLIARTVVTCDSTPESEATDSGATIELYIAFALLLYLPESPYFQAGKPNGEIAIMRSGNICGRYAACLSEGRRRMKLEFAVPLARLAKRSMRGPGDLAALLH